MALQDAGAVRIGNAEYAAVGSDDVLDDLGGVGLPVFRQRFS